MQQGGRPAATAHGNRHPFSLAPVQCMLDLMMWDATERMALIDQPLLLMTGEICNSLPKE